MAYKNATYRTLTNKIRDCHQIPMRASVACLGAILLLYATACPLTPSTPEEADAAQKGDPPRPLEVDEVAYFTYPSDGQWHDSPYIGAYDNQLLIQPEGEAKGINPIALRYQIGRNDLIIDGRQSVRVKHPGRIRFKVDLLHTTGFKGSINVKLTRLK